MNNDAQWREQILLSRVNVEANTDVKWFPAYFSAELEVYPTGFKKDLFQWGVQSGNILQNGI